MKKKQRIPKNFKVVRPKDAPRCAACGVVRSIVVAVKGKTYCPGMPGGKPSCVPKKEKKATRARIYRKGKEGR